MGSQISDDTSDQQTAGRLGGTESRGHRKNSSILVDGLGRHVLAHPPPDRVVIVCVTVDDVSLAVSGGHESLHAQTEQLILVIAEQLFGLLVRQLHDAIFIDNQDRVRGRLNESPEHLKACLKHRLDLRARFELG